MPLIGSRGAGSGKGFGLTSGGKNPPVDVDYLVIAGGGNGGNNRGGGGGAGGYRTSFPGGSKITLDGGETYNITVGAAQNDSVFSTITSRRGGDGNPCTPAAGQPGGSGGGAGHGNKPSFGAGNDPPTSPPQGNPGGTASPAPGDAAGGGGGAAGPGTNAFNSPPSSGFGGNGGPGAANSITGSSVTRGGGGGGGGQAAPGGNGGAGGGGNGGPRPDQSGGTVNTGGGGGGSPGQLGGSGVIFLRAPSTAKIKSVSPGTNTLTTLGPGEKLATFTVTGTITI